MLVERVSSLNPQASLPPLPRTGPGPDDLGCEDSGSEDPSVKYHSAREALRKLDGGIQGG